MTRSRWGYPTAIFGIVLAVLITWAVAVPLFGSPDEPAHLYKAYGTAHGEAIGRPLEDSLSNIRQFDVPEVMGQPPNIMCFIFQADVSAGCVEAGATGAGVSTAAVYPPFWYALVGGGARLVGQDTSQRAYRAVAAALCAALIAAAFAVARRSPARRLSPLLLLGLTPMTLFLAGTVNPNGFEVAGFLLIWSMCLFVDDERASGRAAGIAIGLLVAMLLLSRFASAIWVAAGAVVVMLLLGATGLRRFHNARFLVPAVGLSATAVVVLLAWSRYAGAEAEDPRLATDASASDVARTTWERTPELLRQMIGILGWLDTRLPWITYAAFALLTLVAIAGVVHARDRRIGAATAAVVVGIVTIPIVVNVLSASAAGLIWQGRYTLPLFCMLSLVGMLGWHRGLAVRPVPGAEAAIRWVAAASFVVAEVAAFWQTLRRFAVGAHGKIWLTDPLPWRPAIAPMVLIGAHIALVVALATVVVAGTRGAPSAATATDAATGDRAHDPEGDPVVGGATG